MTLNLENVDDRLAPEPPPEPAPARTTSKPFWRRPWILPLAAVVIIYLYLQIEPVVGTPEAQLPLPPHDNFPLYYPFLITHMAGGTLAMCTMVLQVWPWLRRKYPKVHRVSGRLYLTGSFVAGFAGLVVVWWAMPIGKVGSLSMLIFWIVTSAIALRAARQRNFAKHRRFMLYSFAVAANNPWAFFTYLAIAKLQIPLDMVYFMEGARWVPWVGNLILVQWWLYHTARRPAPVPSFVDR